jgi:teichuronic acid biosynthesis glycosyltransferase TuaG
MTISDPASPLVSVITANYNCERFIAATIESVQKQTLQDWEMIIVDDLSTDNSIDVINKYLSDPRIKLIRLETNQGPAVARNTAITAANGRFMAFLDSDDQWTPEKLELQIPFMIEKDIALSYTEYRKVDEEGRIISGVIERPDRVNYQFMLNSNYIPCLTAIYDSSKLGKVYMPLILKRQDFGLWLDILKRVEFAYCIHKPLAYYRVRKNDSVSSNKVKSALYHWKILRDLEKVPTIKAAYHFIQYAFIGYIKFRK